MDPLHTTSFSLNQTMFGSWSWTERSSDVGQAGKAGGARGGLMESIYFFGPGRPLARSGGHCLRSAAAGRQA